MSTVLHFDEVHHAYTLFVDGGGQKLPSVSQILQKADMYGYPKTATSHEKMQFGTHIHMLTEMQDGGTIGYEDLEDRERGHIQAYERFKEDTSMEVLDSERPIYHPLYLYAAKPDRIARVSGIDAPVIIEIKTGRPHPANMLQLSAYHEAYNAMETTERKVGSSMAVYLSDDGTYKLITNDDHERNFSIFLSCIQILRWKEKHRIGQQARRNGSG